jgi:transcriptional antiterminator NusG
MSVSYASCAQAVRSTLPTPAPHAAELRQWFAVRIRYRFEKKVAEQLHEKGCEIYLPLRTERHSWSDRHKNVTLPLFPGYAFVRVERSAAERRRILETTGLIGFVSFGSIFAPIPAQQIEGLQLLLKENTAFALHPFVKAGQRVRVRGGSLDGLEGVFVEHDKGKLVISIEAIQRSLAIEISGYQMEVI